MHRPSRRPLLRGGTGLLVAALAAGVVTGPAARPALARESSVAPRPGAAGIGDPYFPLDGNGGYDVRSYTVVDRYDPATGALSGTTDVRLVADRALSRFNLDLVLAVDDVLIDGRPVTAFGKDSKHELVVTPASPIGKGDTATVTVTYHGTPGDLSFRGINPWLQTSTETMATNEPQIAPWWFAANDHPKDKAKFDVTVSVPAGREVIGNGELVSQQDVDGRSVWRWQIDQPITTYLAFFAAGDFDIETGTEQGLPYTHAVSRGLSASARADAMALMRRTPGIVRSLEGRFGDYPYSSTGGVTSSIDAGFALENASRPTYPALGRGGFGTGVVVHELAHQWFGNDVSLGRWRDIWLNEGFASWAEWMYRGAHGGRSAQKTMLSFYDGYPDGGSMWRLPINDPGPDRVFAFPVYERGAMAVQALRHRIGRPDFARLLRTWVARRGGGNGTVPQFRALAEQVSGERLDGFFRAWLSGDGKPERTRANGLI